MSSLILDSSTDTIHSDHVSVGRSILPTLAPDFPQPSKSWGCVNQHSSSDRLSPALKSCDSSLESIPTKLPGSPKKSTSKPRNDILDRRSKKTSESKLLSPDFIGEDALAAPTLTDSSGEGTLMESSSDDTIPGSDHHSHHSASGYVRNLLAEAMVDESVHMRVNSPVSVESRSDVSLSFFGNNVSEILFH